MSQLSLLIWDESYFTNHLIGQLKYRCPKWKIYFANIKTLSFKRRQHSGFIYIYIYIYIYIHTYIYIYIYIYTHCSISNILQSWWDIKTLATFCDDIFSASGSLLYDKSLFAVSFKKQAIAGAPQPSQPEFSPYLTVKKAAPCLQSWKLYFHTSKGSKSMSTCVHQKCMFKIHMVNIIGPYSVRFGRQGRID